MAIPPVNSGSFNQPAAKQKASPTTGSQENNKATLPHFLTVFIALCLFAAKSFSIGYFLAVILPSHQVVNAPRVLPIEAITINVKLEYLALETGCPAQKHPA